MIRTSTASVPVDQPCGGGFNALARAVGGTLASNVMVFILGLGTSVILNRSLGPEGKGVFATLLTCAQLIVLCASFGLAKSITYHLARDGEGREKRFRTVVTLGLVTILFGCLSIAVLRVVIPAGALGELLRGFTLPLMLLVAVLLVNSYGLAALRGLRRFRETNLLQPTINVAFLLFLVGAVLMATLDLRLALAAKIGAALVIVPILIWSLRKEGFSFRPALDKPMARGLVGYGLGYFGYSMFQTLNYRFDVLLVSSLTDAASTGYYATATGLAELLWFLPNAIGLVLLPTLAGQQRESGDHLAARSCRVVLPLMVVGTIILMAGAHLLVRTLYGVEFLPTVPVLHAMALGIVTNSLFAVLGTHLASQHRLRQLMAITASGFAVNVLLNLLWIPKWGIIGAAWAGTLSYSVTAALTALSFWRLTGITPMEFLLPKRHEIRALFRIPRQLAASLLKR